MRYVEKLTLGEKIITTTISNPKLTVAACL
jgi:hypothetical protein